MDFLQVFSYVTAFIVSTLDFYSAYQCRRHQALDVASRRPDPVIAVLLCSVVGLIFGCVEEDRETIMISSYGCAVYLYCIAIFMILSTAEELDYGLIRLQFVCYFLAVVVAIRELSGARRTVGTATAWAAASATFATFMFSAQKTVDMLPHWGSSFLSMINGIAWCARGVMDKDYCGASANAIGAFCSFLLLLCVLFLSQRTPTTQVPGQGDQMELLLPHE